MKLKNKIIILSISAILIVSIVLIAIFSNNKEQIIVQQTDTKLSSQVLASELKDKFQVGTYGYNYGESIVNLNRDDLIELEIKIDPYSLNIEKWYEIVQLYEDPELKYPLYARYEYSEENETISLYPSNVSPLQISTFGVSMDVVNKYEHDNYVFFPQNAGEDWGNLNTVYMAVYYDLLTGEKLDNPIVSIVSKEGEIEESPNVDYSVTEDGRIILEWSEIDDADDYFICKLEYNDETGISNSTVSVIDVTQDTKWSPDSALYGDIFSNNSDFKMFDISQDDWADYYDLEALIEEYGEEPIPVSYSSDEFATKPALCVFAVNKKGTSMMSNMIKIEDIANILPYRIAQNEWNENGFTYSDFETYEDLPAYAYVTMCDGYTVKKIIHYETSRASVYVDDYIVIEDNEDPKKENIMVLKIPYSVEGTLFEGIFTIQYFEKENLDEAIAFLIDREEKLTKKGGEIAVFNDLVLEEYDEDAEFDEEDGYEDYEDEYEEEYKDEISNDDEVSITANSALSEYIATCMLSNVETIDLSEFNESADLHLVEDAFLEAYYQNPLILGIEGYRIDRRKQCIYVQYVENEKQSERKQEDILDKVQDITYDIIDDDMSDIEKELAINEYLCDTIVYDEDALENAEENDFKYVDKEFDDSFTAYGALINEKCVCAGYAAAFKLLAEEAGLESVVVTGFLDGNLAHAWNKVKIDGEWQIIDVTNNDTDYLKNALFNLPDKAGDITLVEDEDYVLNIYLSDYDSDDGEKEFYRINDKYFDYDEICDELLEELKENGSAVLRTEYELNDRMFNKIARKVSRKLPHDKELYGYYWLGVIYLEIE